MRRREDQKDKVLSGQVFWEYKHWVNHLQQYTTGQGVLLVASVSCFLSRVGCLTRSCFPPN